DLAVQRALADAENLGRPAPVALGLAQRRLDRRALDVRHRHPRPVQHFGRGSGLGVDGAEGGGAVARLDGLHPLGPLLDAAAELLALALEVHQAVEDELDLLTGDVPDRARDPDGQAASPLTDVARDVARPDFALGGE